MDLITESDTRLTLKMHPEPEVSELAENTSVVRDLTAVLNASLSIAEDFPQSKSQLGLAVANKALSMSTLAANTARSDGLATANFAAAQTLKTIGLLKVANLTPAGASMFITLTMAEKVVSAAGMGNFDKCKMAIAALATTTGMSAFACAGTGVFTLGIGCVAGGLAVAAEAFNVYGQCHKK